MTKTEEMAVAYLKRWWQDGLPRCRVDMTDICEPWLDELKPEIVPLYARPTVPEGLVEEAAKAIYGVGQGHADEPWERAHSRTKMTYRSMASAAPSTLSPASHDSRLGEFKHDELLGMLMELPEETRAAIRVWAVRSTTAPDALREADLAACERAIDRMGWDEIRAFMNEPGQSPSEDAGGYLLRKIKTLFGIKPDRLETYREAARRLVAEARNEGSRDDS